MRCRQVQTFLLLLASIAVSSYGQVSALSPEQREKLLAYELTLPRADRLITAMSAMTQHLLSLPDYQERIAKAMKMTPAERRAQVEADPEAMKILKASSLGVDEYLI